MDFIDLARKRYSVRKFKSQPVEEEKVALILEAARLAPSAKNFQPWHIYVARSEEALAKMNAVSPCVYGAPVVFVVCYNKDEMWFSDDRLRDSGYIDATIVADHMIMEATDLGLGSGWVLLFDPAKLREELDLPDNIVPSVLIPVGYADKGPALGHEKSRTLDELTTEL